MSVTLAVAGLALSGLSTVYGIYKDKEAGVQDRKAQRAQRRINAAQEARKRRSQVRESQVKASSIQAAAAVNGGGASSNTLVAQSSLSTQLATNLNFLSASTANSDMATSALSRAATQRSQGAVGSAIGNFAMQNQDRIDNLFKTEG
jgi:hypothetical protein